MVQEIDPAQLPNNSVWLARSDTGFSKEMIQSLIERLPKGAMLLCLRNGESLTTLDETEMNLMGWYRRPSLIHG